MDDVHSHTRMVAKLTLNGKYWATTSQVQAQSFTISESCVTAHVARQSLACQLGADRQIVGNITTGTCGVLCCKPKLLLHAHHAACLYELQQMVDNDSFAAMFLP